MHVARTRGQGEETKRRAAAMMLSRTGWGETSLPVAYQTVEGRRAPWGCAAGAPYRGTASPPPPPPVCVCVCVCVCGCSVLIERGGGWKRIRCLQQQDMTA